MEILWQSRGRERLELSLKIDGDAVAEVKMKCLGSLEFLRLSQEMKSMLSGPTKALKTPEGNHPAALIWREVIHKIQGSWKFPVKAEELCHCRKVATARVDEAIVYGAHSAAQIRKQTSANTGCGTCLPDIEALIKNRL